MIKSLTVEAIRCQLVVVTQNSQAVLVGDDFNVWGSLEAGIAKTCGLENESLKVLQLDLDRTSDVKVQSQQISQGIFQEEREDQWAVRSSEWFVPRLEKTSVPCGKPIEINPQGSYLVTGGLGGLGLVCCDWLASHGVGQLLLVGRLERT